MVGVEPRGKIVLGQRDLGNEVRIRQLRKVGAERKNQHLSELVLVEGEAVLEEKWRKRKTGRGIAVHMYRRAWRCLVGSLNNVRWP